MWHTVVLIAHVFVAFSLIGLVLLQRGKGAEAGTGFGAGASGTVFGARGSANFLSRTTAILATLFFVTCLSLVYLSTQAPTATTVFDREPNGGSTQTLPGVNTTAPVDGPPSLPLEGAGEPQSGGGDAAGGTEEGNSER